VLLHICTLFNEHVGGLEDNDIAMRQRKYDIVRLHLTGTLMWHDTPGEYFECTRKLTTNNAIMANNNMIFKQVICKKLTCYS
jgi:hypothetical protein